MENLNRYVAGQIERNEIGRFELHEVELTSGSSVELRFREGWVAGHVEHDGQDYVFVSHEDQCFAALADGMEARVQVVLH
jgi:beta-lactamase class D